MTIRSYRDLTVWQKGMDLVVEVYRLTELFPREEQFGLVSQIRRAAVSIPANIAEGHGRLHRADFLRYLSISRGSLTEVETHLEIAIRLEYLSQDQVRQAWDLLQDTGRLLNGLIRALENRNGGLAGKGQISEANELYETDWPLTPDP